MWSRVKSIKPVRQLAILALVMSIGTSSIASTAKHVPSNTKTQSAKDYSLPLSEQESQNSKYDSPAQDGWQFYRMNASGSWDKTMRRFPPSYTVRTKRAGD